MADFDNDIFNNLQSEQSQKKKKKKETSTPNKLKELDKTTKVIGIRFPKDDIEKLVKYFKVESGEISPSRMIKKIVYSYMDSKGIL